MIQVVVPMEELKALCRRRHMRRLALFGSVVREDFGVHSDVDMLVEFAPEHIPGLDIVDIEQELSAPLGGSRVDLVNPKYMNRRLKDRVLAEAEELYAEGIYNEVKRRVQQARKELALVEKDSISLTLDLEKEMET
jgi:predicted nucleotidyltransferase